MRKELLTIEVHCDKTDLKKLQDCDAWVVEEAYWHTDNQRGQAILRQFSVMKDL